MNSAKNLLVHSLLYGEADMFDSLFTNDYIDSATKAYITLVENKRIFTLQHIPGSDGFGAAKSPPVRALPINKIAALPNK